MTKTECKWIKFAQHKALKRIIIYIIYIHICVYIIKNALTVNTPLSNLVELISNIFSIITGHHQEDFYGSKFVFSRLTQLFTSDCT
jgi:hypothetical protein